MAKYKWRYPGIVTNTKYCLPQASDEKEMRNTQWQNKYMKPQTHKDVRQGNAAGEHENMLSKKTP